MIERQVLDAIVARFLPQTRHASPTLFVGPAEECRETARSAAFVGNTEYRTIGFVDTHIPPSPGALGHIVDFAQVLQESGAETVVVSGHLTDTRFQDVVDASLAAGCHLLSVPRR